MLVIHTKFKRVGLITDYAPNCRDEDKNAKMLTLDGIIEVVGFDDCIPMMDFVDGLRAMLIAAGGSKMAPNQSNDVRESAFYVMEALHAIFNSNPPPTPTPKPVKSEPPPATHDTRPREGEPANGVPLL